MSNYVSNCVSRRTTSCILLLLFLSIFLTETVIPTAAYAGPCSSCSEPSSNASGMDIRLRKKDLPLNGKIKIGSIGKFNIIAVYKNGEMVDFFLKNPKTGRVDYGKPIDVKYLTIFKRCFTKKFTIFGFSKTIAICVTVDIK